MKVREGDPSCASAENTGVQGEARPVRVRPEQKAAVLTRTWELFGFGCYYAWLLCVVVCGSFFSEADPDAWFTRACLVVGLAAGYAVLFALRRDERLADGSRRTAVAAGALASGGTALVALPLEGAVGVAATVAGSVAAGLGLAYLMMAGGAFWSSHRGEMALMQLASSVAAAMAACVLLSLLPLAARDVIVCLLPLGCAVILVKSKGGRPLRATPASPANPLAGNLESRFALAILLLSAAFSLFFCAALTCMPSSGAALVPLYVGPAACALFALLLALRVVPARFMVVMARTSALLLVAGALLALASSAAGQVVGVGVFCGGYLLFDEYLWLLHSELIHRSGLPPAEILPRFEGIQWGGILLGFLVAVVVGLLTGETNLGSGQGAWQTWATLACGLVAALVTQVVLSPEDMARILEMRARFDERPSLEARSAALAESCGLSPRERDVLLLLARGRSSNYIQDELGIAQGTVKVHARHIYEKTGASGKQDLINLVERTQVDADA